MASKNFFYTALLFTVMASCTGDGERAKTGTVKAVMDSVITRLYAQVPAETYSNIDDAFMLEFLTEEEEQVLATTYQSFTVNVPVTVSLMRHIDQKTVPFWLEPSGFKKTGMVVNNEEYTYEVWQKKYDAGKITLGINGFDKHRPVYFVTVGAQHPGDSLEITSVYPDYAITTFTKGAFTYHDWSGLVLTAVPSSLAGSKLFTTVRGRAREAHVIGAFRKTIFPAAEKPDQLMLTWSGSPSRTVDIQWRTSAEVEQGMVRFWIAGDKKDTAVMTASALVMEDRMLMNDRYVKRFTAQLKDLRPGTVYAYQAGSPRYGWSEASTFTTAAEKDTGFSFTWLGDTHCFPDSGRLLALAAKRHPEAAFYSIAGDLVSTGLYRDEWDRLFGYAGRTFSSAPLMPVPGNHDRQDGLGAQMYYDLFSLPHNAPAGVSPESSYAFEYGDALFLMVDATSDVDDHTPWIEEKLATTGAKWKFVMFHFPPYNHEEPYADIQAAWVPLFDRYHVDLVMGGHIHYYMRSKPMYAGKVVDNFAKGTVYAISIAIPSKSEHMTPEPYAIKQYADGYFYQHVKVEGNVLRSRTFDHRGMLKDEFTISK